ncbi:metal ABC transporter permease [Simkania negevensis]|uniref:Putative metal transport system membrane protein CT_070 n=1 Tax=Simkania negevensis (strain ATCC VR-1471 / DSM 27360 / Z) TaxID=331113 RepID=F8L6P4_SIMNZ|nr:metal ABC transporter permease [Simkania negevensis]CCB88392.1 putative metal transport system membrane protein CT_070 [Simkania negevensis Z]
MNPYWGKGFGGFFMTLFERMGQALRGNLGMQNLASDEIQILVLVLIACSSALVGTFLVLRRMTMLANSLSHTILLGIVVTFLLVRHAGGSVMTLDFQTLVIAALVTGFLTTFVTEWFHKGLRLQEDASIGLVFTTFFALGIVGVTLFSRNAHLGVETIMGNVDALHLHDVRLAFYLFLFNLGLILVFFKRFALMTFDSVLARNFGVPVVLLNHLLMVQAAATAIGAFRALGVFLFLALLVVPVLTARFFCHRLKPLLVVSCLIGSLGAVIAVAFSRHFLSVYQVSFSTAGLTAMTLGGLFLIGITLRYVLLSLKKSRNISHEKETNRLTRKHRLHRTEHS